MGSTACGGLWPHFAADRARNLQVLIANLCDLLLNFVCDCDLLPLQHPPITHLQHPPTTHPPNPRLEVPTWRASSDWPTDEMRRFFIGGTPQLEDLRWRNSHLISIMDLKSQIFSTYQIYAYYSMGQILRRQIRLWGGKSRKPFRFPHHCQWTRNHHPQRCPPG